MGNSCFGGSSTLRIVEDPAKEKENHAQTIANTLKVLKNHHRAYSVEILSRHGGDKNPKHPPDVITIKKGADGKEDLHVGQHAVHNWNWDKPTNTLTFQRGELGGRIEFPNEESVQGFGTIRHALTSFSVKATLKPVTYELAFSSDAGAYVKQEGPALKLVWDASGDKWKKATWQNNVLSFSYGINEKIVIGQKTHDVTVKFEDLQTGVTYNPAEGDFTFILYPSFQAIFERAKSAIVPVPSNPRSDGKHVFPYLMEFTFNAVASSFEGAVLTKALDAATGVVYAVKATVQNTVSGTFSMEAPDKDCSLVEVSHGRLMVGDEVVPSSRQVGDKITWDSMPPHLAEATDLPSTGTLHFPTNTSEVKLLGTGATGYAFSASQPESLITRATSTSPNAEELLNLSQYKQDGDGNYYDYIQEKSMEDFYTIIQYYMDSDLREKYMGMANPPSLDPSVKQIAHINGSPTADQKANGDDGVASTWYKSLSVAYLTQALPSVFPDDDYAGKLNTIRAQKWLETETSTASVYTTQSSDLYRNRWLENIPMTGQFLGDQRHNTTEYAAYIDQDKSTWEAEIRDTVEDPENQAAMLTIIDKLTRLGKQEKYWAYWLFRDLTQPSALQMLQMLSMGGAASLDGSAFSRRIQQNCAVLGILDDSSEFEHEYIKVIQTFQLTNVLPQLLDFSGDMKDYTYAVMEILKAFQEKYIDSTDPQMAEAAEEIQENMNQHSIEELLSVLQKWASQMEGSYSLTQVLEESDKWYAKLGNKLGKLVATSAVCAGVMMFYSGVTNWSSLSASDKAQVVSDGVMLFTEAAAALLKRGAAIYEIWGTQAMGSKNFGKILLSGDCQKAITRASNGFRRWLLPRKGQTGVGAAVDVGEAIAGEADSKLLKKLFGRNLDEFMATRVGAALAMLGLIFGAIAFSKSQTPLEKAGNALGITASLLQLCASLGGWLLRKTVVAGVSAASICSWLGPLSIVAAFVGVILLIVGMKKHHPTPIESFATDQASDAGLYMEQGADIDSFQSYQPEGQLQKEGISLLMEGSTNQHLQFKLDGSLGLSGAKNGPDTVFYLTTDAYGHTNFIANLPNADNTAIESKFLTLDGNGKLSGSSQLSGSSADEQLWVAECQGSVNRDSDLHLQSASFKFYSYYWYKNHKHEKYYLGGSNNVPSASESNQKAWTVTMASTKPVGLGMDDITLYNYQMDQPFLPTLLNPGSDPRTWSISPGLPDFMELDTSTGKVSQKSGVKPAVTASATYNLKVENSLGFSTTKFTFEVKESSSN